MHKKPYTPEFKKEVVQAVEQGLSVSEAEEMYKVHITSIYDWLRKEGKGSLIKPTARAKTKAPKAGDPATILASQVSKPVTNGKMSLEDFVYLLKFLAADWEATKNKLHDLERQVDRWKILAGQLNNQLSQASGK